MGATTLKQHDIEKRLFYIGLLPILLSVAVIVIFRILGPSAAVFEPPYLLAILNTIFLALMPFTIAYLAGRSYVVTGSLAVLLTGCALLLFGSGNLVAGWAINHPGPNSTVTIHNLASLVASIFYIGAAFGLAEGTTGSVAARRPVKLFLTYFSIVLFVILLSLATIFGLIPPFFIVGTGPTALRETVLTVAVVFHVLSAIFFLRLYWKNRGPFLYWYGLALILIATGLAAVLMQPAVGSPIGWVGRASQYLGGLYLLVAIIFATRHARVGGTSLDKAIASFFKGSSELHYRRLIETAQDAIISTDSRGQVLLWNPAAEKLFGVTREGAIGSPLGDLIEVNRPLMSLLSEEGTSENPERVMEANFKRKDGSMFFSEYSEWVTEEENTGRVVTLIIRDITKRKKAEEALRESEERLRFALETIHTGAWDLDLVDHGAFRSLEHDRIFGYAQLLPEWTYEMFLEHVLPEDRAMVDAKFQRAMENQSDWDFECRIRHTDGQVRWIRASGRHAQDAAGASGRMAGIVQDITERKLVEEALRESEEKFRLLFENMAEGVALHEMIRDDTGKAVDYRILAVNSAYVQQTGIPRETANNALASELYKTSNPPYLAEYQEVVESGEPSFFETYFPPMEKHFSISVICTKPNQFATVFLDITKRKRAEEDLRESEARLRRFYESGLLGVIYWNMDGAIVDANDKFLEMVGYTREDLAGGKIDWIHMTPMEYQYLDERSGIELKATGVNKEPFEKEFIRKDGTRVPVIVAGAMLDEARFNGVAFVLDITDRRKAEETLQKAYDSLELRVEERTVELSQAYEKLRQEMNERTKIEEQLRQSQKMEAIGTLAGGIAHDFNNVLAAILGFTEMAMEDAEDHPEVTGSLQKVLKASMRARDLVKQILAFSRKTNYERAPLSLFPLVKETVQLLRASIPTTIQIRLDVATSWDHILAAPVEVQQIIMNLATNASLAMQETGGTLEIALTDIDFTPDSPVLGPDVLPGEYLQLAVKDTGVGMTPDVMKRVFEPFFTTREVGKGTGMGLAVVYGIVKDLQGTITVESTPGVGSTFRVFLPKVKAEALIEDEDSVGTSGGTERILFIDDEEMLVEWGRVTLERLGYKVTALLDGKEALNTFSSYPSQFDLVITDHTMPGITGLQFAKELLKIKPDTPIILCTGHSETVSPDIAREAGITEYLMKPVAKQELAEAVRRVLDKKQERQ